jgi:hypothetical protein
MAAEYTWHAQQHICTSHELVKSAHVAMEILYCLLIVMAVAQLGAYTLLIANDPLYSTTSHLLTKVKEFKVWNALQADWTSLTAQTLAIKVANVLAGLQDKEPILVLVQGKSILGKD